MKMITYTSNDPQILTNKVNELLSKVKYDSDIYYINFYGNNDKDYVASIVLKDNYELDYLDRL